MSKGAGGGNPQGGSDDTKYIAMLILVAAAGWLLWSVGRGPLAVIIIGPDWLQLQLLNMIGLLDANGKAWLGLQNDILGSIFGTLQDPSRRVDVYALEWSKHFMQSSEITGNRMRWPMAAIMLTLTALVLFRMKGEAFRRQFSLTGRTKTNVFRVLGWKGMTGILKSISGKGKYHPLKLLLGLLMFLKIVKAKKEWVRNMPDFANYQAEFWQVASVGANFDPDADDPRTEQSMTPPEWLRANKISLTEKEGLDVEAAGRAFSRQLGSAWTGVRNAPYHVQAICVMSALNRKWERDKLDGLRNGLAVAHVRNNEADAAKVSKALLAPFLKDDKLVRGIDKVCGKHFYTSTAAVRMYGWGGPFPVWDGGEGAELAPAKFLWLKKVDRNLWYALQQVGRRAFLIEGGGAINHYFYERIGGDRPVSEPKVIQCIEGLQKYLDYHAIRDIQKFYYKEPDFGS